jgi:hypothetical protein
LDGVLVQSAGLALPRPGSKASFGAVEADGVDARTGGRFAEGSATLVAGDIMGGALGFTDAHPATSSVPTARPQRTALAEDRWFDMTLLLMQVRETTNLVFFEKPSERSAHSGLEANHANRSAPKSKGHIRVI